MYQTGRSLASCVWLLRSKIGPQINGQGEVRDVDRANYRPITALAAANVISGFRNEQADEHQRTLEHPLLGAGPEPGPGPK